ncbi:hypothetical protein, partial [Vreelandella rituensis]
RKVNGKEVQVLTSMS